MFSIDFAVGEGNMERLIAREGKVNHGFIRSPA